MKADKGIPWEFAGPLVAGVVILLFLWWVKGNSHPQEDNGHYPAMEEISIEVSKKGIWKLRLIREKALRAQVLEVGEDDWVNGQLVQGERKWPVELRLKGDWTDHLEGGKWSFRVKMKDSTAFKRLRVFSLQNPVTRNFLDEWYFHRVLRQEGVLAPYYDFVRLRFNSAELGVYAIEEHFTKQLLESQGRREGPIVKFSEAGMWEARRLAFESAAFPYEDLPLYEAAHPEAFQSRRFLKEKEREEEEEAFQGDRRGQHGMALDLLHDAKYDLRPASETMNLERMAQQYALTDLFRGHHSLVWHNRRYYFDPIACRLEPVVFDGYSGPLGGKYLHGPFIGYGCNGQTFYNGREDRMGIALFREEAFVIAYYRYLHRYSSTEFLDSLESMHGAALQARERFLRHEYLFYKYDRGTLRRNAEEIRSALVVDEAKVRLEKDGDGWCVFNENPVPIALHFPAPFGRSRPHPARTLLKAHDGRGPADQAYVPMPDLAVIDVRLPGAKSSQLKLSQ